MLRLVLNAAEAGVDILLGDDHLWEALRFDTPTRGTEILAPALRELAHRHGVRVRDIDHIACVAGPGSFTGIRLTLTTAAAMRRVSGARLAGVDFLQAIALMGARLAPDAPQWWVLTHARRDSVHLQGFAPATVPQPLEPVALVSVAAAIKRLSACPGGTVLLGTGLTRNPSIAAACPHARCLDATQPQAEDLWALATQATYAAADITPLYVRPCDAVDNLTHIAELQGMNPEQSHAQLQALLTAPVHEA